MEKINKTHLGVYGLIKKEDKVLLIKKLRGPYTGKLDLPGGKLEHGESIDEGLAREIIEETGIKAKDFELLKNLIFNVDFDDEGEMVSMYHVGLVYTVKQFDESTLIETMEVEDSGGANWYNVDELSEEQLSPFAKEVIINRG